MPMANQSLSSSLFRNDPALQACLVNDAAHVTTGARGDHVAKIQLALSLLDDADIALMELQAKQYGGPTAAAVLAFKQAREIINHSYQTQADNIVGKMTIAAMDQEMLALERRRRPTSSYFCGDPIQDSGGSTSSAPPAGVSAAAFTARFQQSFAVPQPGGQPSTGGPVPAAPRSLIDLDIVWQPTRGAGAKASQMLKYLDKARSLLAPFSIRIVSSVALPDAPFPFDPPVDPDVDADSLAVLKAAVKARPGLHNTLRVIVCPFPPNPRSIFGATKSGRTFAPFVLLNSEAFRTDECTLLHEMIHAANLRLGDAQHDPDKTSVFATGNTRTVLKLEHADEFVFAFFRK